MSDQPIPESYLDLDTVSSLHEIMPDDYSEIVLLFFNTTPEQIESLRRHNLESDLQALAAVAHTIKGSSGNIGAHSLFVECEKLEDGLRSNSIEDPSHYIEKIEAIYLATRNEFEKILPFPGSGISE